MKRMKCSLTWLLAGVLVVGTSGIAVAGPVELQNDGVPEGDGRLNLTTLDFGEWGDQGGLTESFPDNFDPGADPDDPGSNPVQQFPTFLTVTLLHVLGQGKVAFTLDDELDSSYNDNDADFPQISGGPADFFMTLTQPNTMDDLPHSTSSAFTVTPNGEENPIISVNLTQSVSTAPTGPRGEVGAYVDVAYSLTNVSGQDLDLVMVRHIDMDMPWGGGAGAEFWMDDRNGVDLNLCGGLECADGQNGWPAMYAQDGDLTTAALIVTTADDQSLDARTENSWYYGTKGYDSDSADNRNPIDQPEGLPAKLEGGEDGPPCYEDPICSDSDVGDHPSGGLCPFYEFGSDFPYWERPGAPNCWKNHIAGLGYDITGGSTEGVRGDAAIGYQVDFHLPAGDTYNVTFRMLYGFRPLPPRFAAPITNSLIVDQHVNDDGEGEILLTLKNFNPGGGEAPDPIDVLYVDVEAGLLNGAAAAGERTAEFTLLPQGWIAENCTGFDENGHALFRLTNVSGQSLSVASSGLKARFKIRTNDLTEDVNPATGITVPPLSVVISVAQDQPDLPEVIDWTATCAPGDYTFGPSLGNGLWSVRSTNTAFLQVPSFSTWGKISLLLSLLVCGTYLVVRSRRAIAA